MPETCEKRLRAVRLNHELTSVTEYECFRHSFVSE